ncbi:MAG TPA: 3-hydroxyacyl-CoA dehydrogenase NAD-binding domain-containing protein [Planctomycetaceae bacterium]|nr:3-hydroxyacyl-CoA dehydrogenase NAD-binding domain-containing protein [Planctomycetaceae bacterium]
MNPYQHLKMERDGRGVMTVTINHAGHSVNVFDESLLREFAALVAELQQERVARLVVFRSGKSSGFLAGADVHSIQELTTPDAAEKVLQQGQELFVQVESLPMPTVAVIHGPCLGGGLEFALSCTYRVARDDTATRIGLPETQLGLIPGWGGSQRLPRVVGLSAAVRMILEGRRLTTANAVKLGLVDAALNPSTFEDELTRFIDDCLAGRPPKQDTRGWLARWRDDTTLGQALVLWMAGRQITREASRYPALPAALRAIAAGLRHGRSAGLAAERAEFCHVLFDPACRNLLEVFLQRERARKRSTWVPDGVEPGVPIKVIAIMGAGTMGAGIAQLAAAQGYSVRLLDLTDELVQGGMRRIESLTQQAISKQALSKSEAARVRAAITPTTEMSAIADADLVIEAVVEKLDVKQRIFHELDERMSPHVLLATNTSALPISRVGAMTERRDRTAGLHFFNPVHKMPLLEIVRCPETSDRTVAALVDLSRQLGKTPLVVAEGPGFLVSRILFSYLDEAVRLITEGLPADQIDAEAKRFGLPMGPLELLDLVGIDVAAEIAQTMTGLSLEESPTPQRLAGMTARGFKGQKTNQGFYHYRQGRRTRPVPSAEAATGAVKLPRPEDFAGEVISGVQQRLVLSLINSAADCLHDGIVTEPWMVDLGMVLGTGFPPWRGGPMALIDHWGRDRIVASLERMAELCGPRFRPSDYFTSTHPLGPVVSEETIPW